MPEIANDYRSLISGFSWNQAGVLGRPITVTYSFETEADAGKAAEVRASFEAFSDADKATTIAALNQWDDASGLEFVMVAAGQGQIRFAKYNLALMNLRASGVGYYPSPSGSALAGDVLINTAEGQAAFGVTNYLGVFPMLILHEIGHAIGLKHPSEGDVTFDPNNQPPTAMIGRIDGVISAIDRDAIAYLYGPDSKSALTLAGDGNSNLIQGAGFGDTLRGMGGNDTISGGDGVNYLRGDEGDDTIAGGADFDDANGNMGNDTISTGAGEDYCVGGKDNDSLFGGADYDLVYGNLGNDTCDGGDGNDIVRGGQDNDLVLGAAGNDFVSGDKGDDTVTGGVGADIFRTFGDAGIDRVTDFSLAQGDRVQLDPGTLFTVTQVGGDTVISMTGGGQMILAGVQMMTLMPGWIFGA